MPARCTCIQLLLLLLLVLVVAVAPLRSPKGWQQVVVQH
jgi:hypothetical protein